MKIGHISLYPRGGAWVSAQRISRSLGKQDDSWVNAIFPDERDIQGRATAKIDFLCEKKVNAPMTTSMFRSLLISDNLREIIAQKDETSILNLHWVPGHLTKLTRDLFKDRKIVWTLHDMNVFTSTCHHSFNCEAYKTSCSNCPQTPKIMRKLVSDELRYKRKVLEGFDSVQFVTPSKWLMERAQESFLLKSFRISHIAYPIPTEIFTPKLRSERRKQLGIEDQFLLGILGSNFPESKGVNLSRKIVEVASKIRPRDFEILIFGEKFEKPFDNRTHVSGKNLNETEMAKNLAACDLFLFLSHAENLPNLLLEAQSAGVPVMSWDVGGIKETFIDNTSGFITSHNPEEILTQLVSVIDSPDHLKTFGIEGRKHILFNHSGDKIANQYREVYLG